MRDLFLVGAARTPIGAFGGVLSSVPATRLGAVAIAAAVRRSGIAPELIEEAFVGNVLSANLGQAPARQAALAAGLPEHVSCTTVNKVCSSGMKSLILGAQAIRLGDRKVVVAGGMENMSAVPYYAPAVRYGARAGNTEMIDGVIRDGLWDAPNDLHMGSIAELCAREYGIGRHEQDEYAAESYRRALAAQSAGAFDAEIVPVEVPLPKGRSTTATSDEGPAKVIFDKIPTLRPTFEADGTITAANASTLNDGAAALLLADEETVAREGLSPLARVLAWADAEQAPTKFTTSPSLAIPAALRRAGLTIGQIDLFEINEAYAVVALANIRLLGLDPSVVNVAGGAVALGHPLGCSGARIVVTLLSQLRARGGRLGVAAICNGGGGASAVVVELV